jgi:hypothetical protein
MGIVRFALKFPYTLYVLAIFIVSRCHGDHGHA